MKILKETSLIEQYFSTMESLVEKEYGFIFEKELSLKQRNLIQKKYWLQLIDDHLVVKNNVHQFYLMGKYFAEYLKRTGHVADYARIAAHVQGLL